MFISQWTCLTSKRDLPPLQKAFAALVPGDFQDGKTSFICCFKSSLGQGMGSILISSLDECNSPNMAACRAIVCAQRLSRHEHTPGARPHTRQLTPSPQPCYSPSETRVCKSHHDKSPGNFLCSWQLHTHAFSLSCKKSIPNSSSRQKVGCIDTHGTQMVSFQENIFTFEIFYAGSLPGLTPGLSSS